MKYNIEPWILHRQMEHRLTRPSTLLDFVKGGKNNAVQKQNKISNQNIGFLKLYWSKIINKNLEHCTVSSSIKSWKVNLHCSNI